MGTEGIEPSRLAAHDPKSCSSASSDTSPCFLFSSARRNYTLIRNVQQVGTKDSEDAQKAHEDGSPVERLLSWLKAIFGIKSAKGDSPSQVGGDST